MSIWLQATSIPPTSSNALYLMTTKIALKSNHIPFLLPKNTQPKLMNKQGETKVKNKRAEIDRQQKHTQS